MNDMPAIADLLPHAAPMILLDAVLQAGEDYIVCRTGARSDGLFDTDGCVPAFAGIEYMAQAIAAYSGLERQRCGEQVQVGFLLGTRRFESNVANFPVGTQLEVRAEKLIRGNNGMASFACTVSGAGVEQSATLSVFEPGQSEAAAMLERGNE